MLANDTATSRIAGKVNSLISNILVPIDFSKRCAQAATFAVGLARQLDAKVTLLHVERPIEDDHYWNRETARWAKEELARILPEFSRDSNVQRVVSMHPSIANGILRFSYEHDFDLIAMPTHGYGAIRKALLGSVTATVLRAAPCPVWTSSQPRMHLDPKHPNLQRILCAVNSATEVDPTSAADGSKALSWAAELASVLDARLYVAWSRESLSETREQIDRLEDAFDISAETVTEPGNVPDALRHTAAQLRSDLLVVSREFGNPLEESRLDTYEVVRESPCPVVSM